MDRLALSNMEQIRLFQDLNIEQKMYLQQIAEQKTVKKYSYIYSPKESADRVHFLLEGRIKICSYNEIGKELIKTIHYPGEMFGESGLLETNRHEDFAQAMDKGVVLLSFNTADFKTFLCNNPSISIKLTSNIGDKLKAAQKRIENFIFKSARSRIIDFIKDIAGKQGQKVGYEILIKNFLTHNEIASLIGTSRQTVTIVLNELKKSNQIHIDRKNVLVRDIDNLR